MKSRRKKEQVKKGAKGKPPVVSTKPIPWDIGAEGAANRRGLIVESRGDTDPMTGKTVNPNARIGVRRETWVDRYERKEMLTAAQANAARHLRSRWKLGRAARVARSFSPGSGGPSTCGPSGESAPQAERLERRMGHPSAVITSHKQARRADRAAAWGRGGPVETLACRRGCPSPAAHYPHFCQRLTGADTSAAHVNSTRMGPPWRTRKAARRARYRIAPNFRIAAALDNQETAA